MFLNVLWPFASGVHGEVEIAVPVGQREQDLAALADREAACFVELKIELVDSL